VWSSPGALTVVVLLIAPAGSLKYTSQMLTNKQAYFSRTDLSRLSAELNSSLDSSRSYAFSLTTETTMKSCYEWVTGKGLGLKSQKRSNPEHYRVLVE
jgi:Tfp pilus assembly protein FimT